MIYFILVPPLSLAINQPELPEGETEPEILILDRGAIGSDARFLHIMVGIQSLCSCRMVKNQKQHTCTMAM